MAGFTSFLANLIRNNLLRTLPSTPSGWTNPTRPGSVYVGLFTTAPTDAYTSGTPTGVEVTGGSYARAQVTQADASWAAPTGSPAATSNAAQVAFPQATADWGTVVAFGIFDAASAGNLLEWYPLTANRTVPNGATASFSAGSLAITLD